MLNLILAVSVLYSFLLGYSLLLRRKAPLKESELFWDHSQILLLPEGKQE